MTPRTWAEKIVAKVKFTLDGHGPEPLVQSRTVEMLLEDEHARAVRIVKAEIKRVKLDQHTLYGREKDIAVDVLNNILAALQRGRRNTNKGGR